MDIKNLFSVTKKIVLVTGGNRGIGLMIAAGFVSAGNKVYICGRDEKQTNKAADELNKKAAELSSGGMCVPIQANIATEAECIRVSNYIKERESSLHVLVNNAGCNWGETFETYPASAWDKVLDLNVKSIFYLTRACTPLLEKAASEGDPARVINIGSIDGIRVPALETYAYSTSKAAVHQLTRVLAAKLAAKNITVNAIAAGPFPSKMMNATLSRFKKEIIAGVPLGRIGEPEDVAGLSLFLSSRGGSYITGAIIPLEGGILVRSSI
eukprot:GEZU01007529.1.p1 GENE.GEZU01007529.1~~GEZU01007529.1.p1  ORF type:complete len:268 (+),score=75.28 GEZU01007529.1:20-823(+)